MPLYEYECQQCHRRTEKRQKFSDPEITECPFCKGHLERVLSAPAFSFTGGGWYKDLYSSAKPAAGTTAKSNGAADSNGSSKPASDTPAPAAAAAPSSPAPASSASNKS